VVHPSALWVFRVFWKSRNDGGKSLSRHARIRFPVLTESIHSVQEIGTEAQGLDGLSYPRSPRGISRTAKKALQEARGCEGRSGQAEARSRRWWRVVNLCYEHLPISIQIYKLHPFMISRRMEL
jgi:hypothetical protein